MRIIDCKNVNGPHTLYVEVFELMQKKLEKISEWPERRLGHSDRRVDSCTMPNSAFAAPTSHRLRVPPLPRLRSKCTREPPPPRPRPRAQPSATLEPVAVCRAALKSGMVFVIDSRLLAITAIVTLVYQFAFGSVAYALKFDKITVRPCPVRPPRLSESVIPAPCADIFCWLRSLPLRCVRLCTGLALGRYVYGDGLSWYVQTLKMRKQGLRLTTFCPISPVVALGSTLLFSKPLSCFVEIAPDQAPHSSMKPPLCDRGSANSLIRFISPASACAP